MRHFVFIWEIVDKLGADKAIHGFKEGKPLGFRFFCTRGCVRGCAGEGDCRELGNLCSGCPRIRDRSRGLRRTEEASSGEGNSEASGQPKRDDE